MLAVSAVHDGYVLQKATTRAPLGGALLTQCMLRGAEAKGAPILPRCAVRRVERTPGNWEVHDPCPRRYNYCKCCSLPFVSTGRVDRCPTDMLAYIS